MLVSFDYGTAAAATQVERLILILMMGLLTSAIVYRMQRLVEMSGNDGLTGLPNRAWLLQGMPRMFETIRDDGGSLTLALLDLDRFKRINDRSEEHTSDLQSLQRTSYAVFCLKKKKTKHISTPQTQLYKL